MIEVRPAVPSLAVRHYRGEGDLPALHRVWSAAAAANGVEELKTLEDFRRDYASLVNCDLSRDLFLAEVGGEAVAYSRVFWQDSWMAGARTRTSASSTRHGAGAGIGSTLHELNEERLREVADGHQMLRQWLASESVDADAGAVALLRRDGTGGSLLLREWHGARRYRSGRRCPTHPSCVR